ncbi:MAG: phosphatase PAP2 family protein [Myxococcota bacterium]|nr:phosphatase PAP2 family protein [Myxococcota bacterium]
MLALAAALVVAQGSPFKVDWSTDGLVTGALGLVYATAEEVVKPGVAGQRACRAVTEDICDPAQLNALDRLVLDNQSSNWRLASNIIQYATFAVVLGATGIDAHNDDQPFDSWGRDSIVFAETILVTQLTTNILKYSMRRARPSQYRVETDITFVEEQLSFPSGHTSSVAAASTAYTFAFAERHPDSPMRYAVGGIGAALTVLTGYARAQSGRHFYTDVISGAAIGLAIGYLVPWMHRMSPNATRDASADVAKRSGPPMVGFGMAF